MNTLTTYFYKGANDSDVAESFICLNGHCYVTAYIEVAIYYGPYNGADVVPATQPKMMPPLMNVEFNAKVYRATAGGVPKSKHSVARLIARQDIYDLDNPRDCLGTKFTFQSDIIEDCSNLYCLVWSTNRIEMPYGPNMIYIDAQNGVSSPWSPCV